LPSTPSAAASVCGSFWRRSPCSSAAASSGSSSFESRLRCGRRWAQLAAASELPQNNLYLFGVYVLSFLHVLHVVGGLVPLVWVALRSRRGGYTAEDHEGVTLAAMYWHFLGVVWLGILAVLVT